MSDTSLVFNLVARDQASGEVSAMGERFNTAAAGIGVGFAAVLGASVMQSMDMEAAGDKLAAQLGLGPAEAAEVAQVSAGVFKAGWGDSIETVNLAVKGVYQNIGDTSTAEGGLEGVTTKAIALASTFDQDVTMATAAAGQMMRTGLADNADEAFDILTVGLSTAADKSGDLLETFNEYSVQFKRLGIDGQTATGLIAQGLEGGARDADQVADALGQFGERALAGGTAVDDAYKSIGLNADTMAGKIGKGGASAEEALGLTLNKLRGTKDEQVRLNAAAALFGDPANVMGDALYALDPATAAAAAGMDKAGGAADRMAKQVSDNPKAAFESFKRTVMVELGDAAGFIGVFAMENQGAIKPLMYTFAGLAALVLTVKGAMIVYSAVSAVVAAAHWVMDTSVMKTTAGWIRMNAVGLASYARLGAAAVLSAARTAAAWVGSALVSIGTWVAAVVRAALTAVAQFALMAARAVAWALVMAAQWLIAMGPIGWVIAVVIGLVALIIANWSKVKAWTVAAWNAVVSKVKGAGAAIVSGVKGAVASALAAWNSFKAGVVTRAAGLVTYVKSIPGKIKSALGSLGSLLTGAGKNVVRGLLNGIVSMGGWLAGKLTSFAKNSIPGPIAKALGINSPARLLADEIGHWVPPGIAMGAEDNRGVLDKTMASLVTVPAPVGAMAAGRQMAPAMAAPMYGPGYGQQVVRLEFGGAEREFLTFFKKITRTDRG